jgi:hypothetical protein
MHSVGINTARVVTPGRMLLLVAATGHMQRGFWDPGVP